MSSKRAFMTGAGIMTVVAAAVLFAIDRYLRMMEQKLRTT